MATVTVTVTVFGRALLPDHIPSADRKLARAGEERSTGFLLPEESYPGCCKMITVDSKCRVSSDVSTE
jgi:hypothetical protein